MLKRENSTSNDFGRCHSSILIDLIFKFDSGFYFYIGPRWQSATESGNTLASHL